MTKADEFDLAVIEEIGLAIMYPEPGGELDRADFEMLYRAAESGVVSADAFAIVVRKLRGNSSLVHAPRERFDWAMDYLYGYGFRDRDLPEVSPDYLAFLDVAKRALGISDQDFGAMLARAPGKVDPGHITGEAFGWCLYEMFTRRGLAVPLLPQRSAVGRQAMSLISAAVAGLGLTYAEHVNVVIAYGGGCLRSRELDVRGLQRVMSRYMAAGWSPPEPPPRIAPRPGFITQAQVNLICKLARDIGLPDRDALDGWLRVVAGIEGGLQAVTLSGATYVIDRMLPLAIGIRDMLERERCERAARQIAEAMAMVPAE